MTSPKQPLDLVLAFDKAWVEEDWWRFLLSDFDVRIHKSPDCTLVIPNALYVFIGSQRLDGQFDETFLAKVAAAGNCGILHLGDEFCRGPYQVYASFAYVMRLLHTTYLKSPAILTVPHGPSKGLTPPPSKLASQRRYAWSLIGARKTSRAKMADAWDGFEPAFVSLTRPNEPSLSRQTYLDTLAESVFFPAPMGNVMLETLRPYEALEYGAIPVLQRRPSMPWPEALFGADHPVPQFDKWSQARAYAERLMADPVALDAEQAKLAAWWTKTKADYRKRVHDYIVDGQAGKYRAEIHAEFKDWPDLTFTPRRYVEILKHHDADAIMGRLELTASRIKAKLLPHAG